MALHFKHLKLFSEQNSENSEKMIIGPSVVDSSGNIFRSYTTHGYLEPLVKYSILFDLPRPRVVLPKVSEVQNPVMINYWSKYVDFFSDKESERNSRAIASENFFLDLDLSVETFCGDIKWIEFARAHVARLWNSRLISPENSLFELKRTHIEYASGRLQSIGLLKGEPFITIHVRDAGYHKGRYDSEDAVDSYRNANINDYIPGIQDILAHGYKVIVAGDPSMRPSPNIPGVIDYAHSSIRDNATDIFIFAACEFFVGTSSGPILVPPLFGTPVIATNMAPFAYRLPVHNSLILPKLIYSVRDERFLTVRENLTMPHAVAYSAEFYKKYDLKVVDNTPELISSAIQEMFQLIDRGFEKTPISQLQRQIDSIFSELSPYGSVGLFATAWLQDALSRKLV
jgi:putative glycosyltransferase (TIGR04372 family)